MNLTELKNRYQHERRKHHQFYQWYLDSVEAGVTGEKLTRIKNRLQRAESRRDQAFIRYLRASIATLT